MWPLRWTRSELCFDPAHLLRGSQENRRHPLPPVSSSTPASPGVMKNTLLLKRPDGESRSLFFFHWVAALLCDPHSESDAPCRQSGGRQSLSRFGSPCPLRLPGHPTGTLPEGLPPLPPHTHIIPLHLAPLRPPWRALHALDGLLSASAILDSHVNICPKVKGHCPPLQGHQEKAKNPQLGGRGSEEHSRNMAARSLNCVTLGKWPSLSGPVSFDRAGQTTLPGPLGLVKPC